MIKVLHVIRVMDRGGAETMIMNLYRKIDRSRIQFDFLVHLEKTGDYDREIEELGGRKFYLPEYKVYNEISYRKACRDFFRKHGKEYDIVHGHIESCARIYLREAKKSGCFAIAHCHACNMGSLPAVMAYSALCYPTRFRGDYFLACSGIAGEQRFGKRVVQGERFQVLKNGIDASLYRYDPEKTLQAKREKGLEDKVVFGHVGRFTDVKNHEFLIDVFEQIHRKMPQSVLLLAGRGELEEKIREKAEKLGLSSSVLFLGVQEDIANLMRQMDVFLFPSKHEGLGIVVIEAQASGLPCYISSGIPEEAVVTGSVTRLSLDRTAKEWAEKILTGLEKYKRKDQYQEILHSGFDIGESCSQLMQIYTTACKNRG